MVKAPEHVGMLRRDWLQHAVDLLQKLTPLPILVDVIEHRGKDVQKYKS